MSLLPQTVKGWGCYEQLSVLPSFNEGRFPFCQVLEENKVTFYWSHDHKKEGKWAGVKDRSFSCPLDTCTRARHGSWGVMQ